MSYSLQKKKISLFVKKDQIKGMKKKNHGKFELSSLKGFNGFCKEFI
tara:strand:+ start:816 stop:956 length:141 start_codon:yes stop_codon:yes gene_type:complete